MMVTIPDVLKKVSFFFVCSLIFVGSVSAEEEALAKMLHPDGSLKLESGFSGHLDPSGYRMATGPDGSPRFLPVETSVASPPSDPDNVYWDDQFCAPAVDNDVLALAADAKGNVYVGGIFTWVGGLVIDLDSTGIVKWNGASWSGLGEGVDGPVYAIAVDGSDVYVGGEFITAGSVTVNNVAKWNGESWSALGSGTNGPVHAIAVNGDDVYVEGTFSTAGGGAAKCIARWNGSSWSALGSGVEGGVGPPFVQSLAVIGEEVYAGGGFDTAGGVSANRIAKWDGSSWSALGSGTSGRVHSLVVIGSDLYAGGPFFFAGGIYVGGVGKWDGSDWSSIGAEANRDGVHALTVDGTDLYVAGRFTVVGATDARSIAKWDGSNWYPLGGGGFGYGYEEPGWVEAVTVSQGNVYAGGLFYDAGDTPVDNIARWDGSRWYGLGSGMAAIIDPAAYAITVEGDDIYIGGNFFIAGGIAANNIVKWDGSTWSALGSGTNHPVRAIAVSGTDVYAGGYFTTAGGISADHVAKWNGSSWSPLGSGTDAFVRALAVVGTDLYAGGQFTQAGGGSANYIARWDGSSWHSLGSGTDDTVYALATMGTDLYAGGLFSTAGGVSSFGIARWDGSSWHSVGTSPGAIFTLATDGSNLYAAGDVTPLGDPFSLGFAKWDGLDWSLLGCELNDWVWALAASRGNVYAGGEFNLAGSTAVNSIAHWDGSEWSAFGTGLGSDPPEWFPGVNVQVLATVGDALLIGGYFWSSGGKAASGFARWMPRVNVSHLSLTASPGETTLGNDVHGFYKPALTTGPGTTVSYSGGLPVDVTMEMADEIHVGGLRVNGACTLDPDGVMFGGTGATLRLEFSEDDVAAYVPTHADDYTDFRAVRLTYPPDYPSNKEAAEVEMLSDGTAVPIRVQNGRQIYAITIPFSGIGSMYGAVPRSLAQPSSAGSWWLLE